MRKNTVKPIVATIVAKGTGGAYRVRRLLRTILLRVRSSELDQRWHNRTGHHAIPTHQQRYLRSGSGSVIL